MENISALIHKKLQLFRILHLLMVMSDMLYAIVMLYLYKYNPIKPTITDISTINIINYASLPLLIFIVFIVIIVRKKMLSSDSLFERKVTNNSNVNLNEPAFLSNYLSMLFTLWTIIGTISIIGIVLFLLSGNFLLPLVLVLIGAFFKLMNGARFEELNQLSIKYEKKLKESI